MNTSVYLLVGTVFVFGPNVSAHSAESSSQAQRAAHSSALTEEIRKELLDARQTAWTAFFQKDQAVLEEILAPELIAIQQTDERWDNRTGLLAMAKSMSKQGAQLVRLEFPRTEIQLFGDTAILYYTYIFEMANQGRTGLDAGRGTEVFVRRDGKWVDVGWHLDNGAFVRQGDQWVRVGESYPEPTPVSSSKPR